VVGNTAGAVVVAAGGPVDPDPDRLAFGRLSRAIQKMRENAKKGLDQRRDIAVEGQPDVQDGQ